MTDPEADLRAWAPKPGDHTARVPRDEPTGGMWLRGYSDFRQIAEGGEGTIYRARQDGLDRYVAVKVINVGDPSRLARFRRELEITVRLGRQHPHIVTVIDTGTAPGGRPCIVMEYYDLGSLYDRLREHGPLPVAEVVAAGVAVADALSFAHAQGFLHRDVKPQNILVLPTSYVLADFGIARMADARHTTSLQMVSYRHAAPQMIDGQSPAAADDLWSLGSTLFTLLDGAPPFSSENPDEDTMLSYLDRVRSTEPRPVRRSDVPPELAAVIARCLSKRREDRYPDAAAVRAALSAINTEPRGWTPSMPVADFGPQPAPPVIDPPPPPPPPAGLDPERTTLGPGSDLAGLTVRMSDDRTALPDFGPSSGGFGPTPTDFGPSPADFGPSSAEPGPVAPNYGSAPVAAVLPAPTPWQPETTTVLPPGSTGKRSGKARRALLFGVVALLVGGAVGVLVTVLNGLNDQVGQQPPPASTTAVPPSIVEQSPGTSPPPGNDPAFAPTLNRLEDQGERITLIWTDPTDGRAQFVVVDVTGQNRQALATVAAGTTTYTVEGLDPGADQYCFQVLAIGLADPTNQRGVSDRTCAER